MEYQNQTIGLYGVEHTGELSFNLIPKKTNCLAPDKCGIPPKTQTTTKKMWTIMLLDENTTK